MSDAAILAIGGWSWGAVMAWLYFQEARNGAKEWLCQFEARTEWFDKYLAERRRADAAEEKLRSIRDVLEESPDE